MITRTGRETMRAWMLAAALLWAGPVLADEIRVVSSGGFSEAYKVLGPQFEKATGHRLINEWGPSMGDTINAVPQRMARNEPIDVLIMAGSALQKLVDAGRVADRVDLAQVLIVGAVKQGAPTVDISTVDKLRAALLAAPSIAYSDSASGMYMKHELFKTLGIEAEMARTARMIPAEPVGYSVARGEAALGFQARSEMLPIPGITIVGLLPDAVQKVTVFSGGILTNSNPQRRGTGAADLSLGPGERRGRAP